MIGSPIFGFKTGFLEISNPNKNEITTNTKTMHSDQCTPSQLMVNPATAGPKIEAICHVELFQVAAFGYTFLGTISDTKEKMVGPKKARNNPPKKTNP